MTLTYSDIIKSVAEELQLPEREVDRIYRAYWRFIKDSIASLPLKDDLTEEEFNALHTNFNIPSIGKLHCTYDRYRRVKKRFEYIKQLQNGRLD